MTFDLPDCIQAFVARCSGDFDRLLLSEREQVAPSHAAAIAFTWCCFRFDALTHTPGTAWRTGFPYFGDAADFLDGVGLWNRERMRAFVNRGQRGPALSGRLFHFCGDGVTALLDPGMKVLHVFAATAVGATAPIHHATAV